VIGSFLSQLDATMVNVSLSTLAVELHSSLTAIQWVTSDYLLALILMLPLNGWLVERIGAKSLSLSREIRHTDVRPAYRTEALFYCQLATPGRVTHLASTRKGGDLWVIGRTSLP
jgi:MFS family permease